MLYDKDTIEAPFLPQRPCNDKVLREAVLNNLEATLGLIKPLPLPNLTLESLKNTPYGVYRIKEEPSVQFWHDSIAAGHGEIGLLKIKGINIISINHDFSVRYPDIINCLYHQRIFEKDIHTHPKDLRFEDHYFIYPSFADIGLLDNSVDGKKYIFSTLGLSEFQIPDSFPETFPGLKDVNYWLHQWRRDQLEIVKREMPYRKLKEYDFIHNILLPQKFFEQFFKYRLIPWENGEEIENVLLSNVPSN